MFLLRSRHPQPPRPALNAIPPAPDRASRRNRNLDRCEELGDLGMDLVRAAHREALRDMQPPPERTPTPGSTYDHTPAPRPRDTIFGQLFALISRCLRQTMLLEDRFAAGDMRHPGPEIPAHGEPAAPPRPAAQTQADRTRICPDRLRPETLEDETRTPDNRPVPEILADIRTQFEAATPAGPIPGAPRRAPASYRRPIPIIPPGPKIPLSAAERSALHYHMNRVPKKPDG